MSYVRWGQDGSDVYIFDHVNYGLFCDACPIRPHRSMAGFIAGNNALMLAHIERHRDLGHHVPEYVSDRLREEARA